MIMGEVPGSKSTSKLISSGVSLACSEVVGRGRGRRRKVVMGEEGGGEREEVVMGEAKGRREMREKRKRGRGDNEMKGGKRVRGNMIETKVSKMERRKKRGGC